jgi:hypothetical protein
MSAPYTSHGELRGAYHMFTTVYHTEIFFFLIQPLEENKFPKLSGFNKHTRRETSKMTVLNGEKYCADASWHYNHASFLNMDFS